MSKTYERTRLCGCGECRFYPISKGPCPQENSKKAIWLWAEVFTKEEPEEVENTLDPSVLEEETLEDVST